MTSDADLEVPSISNTAPESPTASWDRTFAFLLGAIVLAGLIAFGTASLPPRFRWLGLLAALQGAMLGAGLRLWRERVALPHSRYVVLFAAGLGSLTWFSTATIHVRNRLETSHAAGQMMRQFAEQARAQGSSEKDLDGLDSAGVLGSPVREFHNYLRSRVRGWHDPWPVLLWVVEALLAAIAAGWCVQPTTKAAVKSS